MALPRILKDFNVFYNGASFIGQCMEFTRPKLSLKMEDYSAAGIGPIKVFLGHEPLECEHNYGGHMEEILQDYGGTLEGVMLRFSGAYQREDSEDVDQIEVVIRGRHQEIDSGSAKPGEKTEFKVKTACTYYKETINDKIIVEVDLLNKIFNVNGVDRYAEIRKAMGL